MFYAVAVGQGDSAIIQCPDGKDLLIVDMGAVNPWYRTYDYIRNLLKYKFGAANKGKNIHVLVSHPHFDHYGYFSKVLDSELLHNVRSFILGGKFTKYKKYFQTWLQKNLKGRVYTINNQNKCFGNKDCKLTPIATAKVADFWTEVEALVRQAKDSWQFCSGSTDVKFTVLGANIGSKPNEQSVILKIQYKSWSMLMSGDFEQFASQQKLINHYKSNSGIFKSNYYKVAHHGAWSLLKPNIPALLDLIKPEKVYISHGHPSLNYHHPKYVTIKNLKSLPSIVKIDPHTNALFVYWDKKKEKVVVLKSGLNRAIYETCRFIVGGQQVCQDIEITTNGKSDTTKYISGYSILRIKVLQRLLEKI